MTKIELSYVSIQYKAPIVYFYYKSPCELGFPELKELIQYAEKLSGYKPYVTLSDVRLKINVTEQSKKYLANPDHLKYFRGTAAIVKNEMISTAANFLSFFDKKPYPFKAFTKTNEAEEWLKSLPLDNTTSFISA